METALFRDPVELAEQYDSFQDWPPAERLLLKCMSVWDIFAEGKPIEASLLRDRLGAVVERAQRRRIISEAQAWVMRRALEGEEI